MTMEEDEVLKKFLKEQMEKGYIWKLKSPYASAFFFIKKKDGKLWLLEAEPIHHPEQIPIAVDPRVDIPSQKCQYILKVWYKLGLQ